MTSLYNCKHSGDQYRITKFTSDFNVEASYLLDADACGCPAGHRPSCRHRQMLPKFIQRDYVGSNFFFDFDRGGWVQRWKEEPTEVLEEQLIASAALLQEPSSGLTITTQREVLIDDSDVAWGLGQPNDVEKVLDRAMGADADSWQSLEPSDELILENEDDEEDDLVGGFIGDHNPYVIGEGNPLQPHSPMAKTTDFESVGDGSSPSVAAKGTIRRRV